VRSRGDYGIIGPAASVSHGRLSVLVDGGGPAKAGEFTLPGFGFVQGRMLSPRLGTAAIAVAGIGTDGDGALGLDGVRRHR